MSIPRTLSEIAATCTKAARAAGCPWGMAEDAGLAARVLSAHGLPGPEALAEMLKTPRQCACSGAAEGPLCGLAEMAACLDAPPDARPNARTVMPETAGPLFLIAFALSDGGAWLLTWPGGSARCGPAGLQLSGQLPAPVSPMTLAPSEDAIEGTRPDWRSRPVDPQAWEALEAWAARTLVPETEHSRTAGAGPDE